MHKDKGCRWCRRKIFTMYFLVALFVITTCALSYFLVYPLFKDYKEVLKLRESNFIPSIYPVEGKITGRFNDLRKIANSNKYRYHHAIDIACPVNTKIRSMANGHVVKIELTAFYGVKVTVIHVSKKHRFKTIYAHLYKAKVAVDEFVLRGDVIGLSGNTGSSQGPHLHLEVWKARWRYSNLIWKSVAPEPYCKGWIK